MFSTLYAELSVCHIKLCPCLMCMSLCDDSSPKLLKELGNLTGGCSRTCSCALVQRKK